MFIKFDNISGWKGLVYGRKRLVGDKLIKYLPTQTYNKLSEEDYSDFLGKLIMSSGKKGKTYFIRGRGEGILEDSIYKVPGNKDYLWGLVMLDTNNLLNRLGYYVDEIIHGAYEIYIVALVPENVEEGDVHQVLSNDVIYFPGDKRCEYSIYPDLIDNPFLSIRDQNTEASMSFLNDWFGVGEKEKTTIKKKKMSSGTTEQSRILYENDDMTFITLDDVYMSQRFMGLYILEDRFSSEDKPWINFNVSNNPFQSAQYFDYMKIIGDEIYRSIKIIRKNELSKLV